ncbi:MAG: hypothetical protein M1587_07490, partial [Thaumarchaeota archaeon]|nr:hypothetical protein [Nitrososphaerota archaeon]
GESQTGAALDAAVGRGSGGIHGLQSQISVPNFLMLAAIPLYHAMGVSLCRLSQGRIGDSA